MEHLAGVRLIPANQFDDSIVAFPSDTTGGKFALLMNDEYYIPGTFKNALNTFDAPLERADASGQDIIQSTNLEEIFVIVPKDGYEFYLEPFYTGTPGAVVDERAVVGGYQTMADGQTAKLYALNVYGSFGSYNSVTGNGYKLDDDTPIPADWMVQLIFKRKNLVW